MILNFKKKFVKPILCGDKIHSIREDKPNRWEAGRKIQMTAGVRTKNCFKEANCESIQVFKIVYDKDYKRPFVYVDGVMLRNNIVWLLAENDGFDSDKDFYDWFNKDFEGKIIHWTDFKY